MQLGWEQTAEQPKQLLGRKRHLMVFSLRLCQRVMENPQQPLCLKAISLGSSPGSWGKVSSKLSQQQEGWIWLKLRLHFHMHRGNTSTDQMSRGISQIASGINLLLSCIERWQSSVYYTYNQALHKYKGKCISAEYRIEHLLPQSQRKCRLVRSAWPQWGRLGDRDYTLSLWEGRSVVW